MNERKNKGHHCNNWSFKTHSLSYDNILSQVTFKIIDFVMYIHYIYYICYTIIYKTKQNKTREGSQVDKVRTHTQGETLKFPEDILFVIILYMIYYFLYI